MTTWWQQNKLKTEHLARHASPHNTDMANMLAYKHIQQTHSIIHVEFCFWRFGKCKFNIYSHFSLCFALHQSLTDIFSCLDAKCSM